MDFIVVTGGGGKQYKFPIIARMVYAIMIILHEINRFTFPYVIAGISHLVTDIVIKY